jgi:hypothetical protein
LGGRPNFEENIRLIYKLKPNSKKNEKKVGCYTRGMVHKKTSIVTFLLA